jgi:two-component system, chemotaxis family, response regulator Rcp1
MLQILLAEDNPGDVFLVQQALEKHSVQHELHLVEDGEKAISFVAHMGKPGQIPCPDVVLLDMNLPKADGVEVLSEFRKHPECAHVPVILITSSDARKDRLRVAALGIAHYFKKPADLDAFFELGAIVRQVVEGYSA